MLTPLDRPSATVSLLVCVGCLALALSGCGGETAVAFGAIRSGQIPLQSGAEAAKRPEPVVTVPEGPPPKTLVIEDLIEGEGPRAEMGDKIAIRYLIRRWDGSLFSNAWNYLAPQEFRLGEEITPAGLYASIVGMRAGGRRWGLSPASRMYYQPVTPLDWRDNIVFIVDLVEVNGDSS